MALARALVFTVLLAGWPLAAPASEPAAGGQPAWVTPDDVLVLFNTSWPDEDGNRRSDSQDVAEYYAGRRGVPAGHLLGLAVTGGEAKAGHLTYREFFRRVLVPTQARLTELAARGATIHYLVTCYGMPLTIDTNLDGRHDEHPIWKPTESDASRRSLAGWLVNLEENVEAGFDPVTGKPGPRGGGSATPGSPPLGAVRADIAMPWIHRAFDLPGRVASFKTLRAAAPARRGTYLVTHLGGETLETSLGLVDKALYAERYLRNFVDRPTHPYFGRVWLDHNGGDGAGHRGSLLTAALWFKGLLDTSVFAQANRGQPWFQGPPWSVSMDNAESEIGSGKPHDRSAPLHVATVSGVIDRVDPATGVVTLVSSGDPGRAVYFSAGEVVESSSGGRAAVIALTSASALRLSTVARFAAGDRITWRSSTGFPLDDVAFYYGYYGLAQYHDVYRFRVGAVGSHMDSASVVWAQAAMRRGITATAGAVSEPSSRGLPFMSSAFAALTSGHDVAEAFYSAIPYNTRWNAVIFGDPLYAPFRTRAKREDETPPVIERLALQSLRSPGGGRRVLLRAELAGATPEQADDVAVWQVEYGLTPAHGSVVPYIEWPDPDDRAFSERRRYDYTRRFVYELAGLLPGQLYHVRVSARDPFGNVGTATTTIMTGP